MTIATAPLGELASITSGFAFKSSAFNTTGDGLPLIRIRDVITGKSETFYSGEYKADYVIENGDALIGMDGEFNLAKWRGGRALLNQRVCKVEVEDERLDQEYLVRLLPKALKEIEARTPFVTVKHLSVKELRAIEIPLPPIPEQRRIAAILDKADALRAKRRQAIAKCDQLLQSVFLEMFGDPMRNPHQFPTKSLVDFYVQGEGTKCGPFGSALKKSEITESGVPVWNMDNIGAGGRMVLPFRMWISEVKAKDLVSYSVNEGDILISRAGTVGKMCVARSLSGASIISTNLIRLRLGDGLLPEFFVALMTYCKGRIGRLRTGPDGAFTHMNTGILDSLRFPYPPVELQRDWLLVVEKIEAEDCRLQMQGETLNSLFASLQHRAFSGQLSQAA